MSTKEENDIVEAFKGKIILGSVEKVSLMGYSKKETVEARIDTGAASSSIDSGLVKELKLGPVIAVKKIRNAHGETLRPTVEAKIMLKRKKMTVHFTVTDRSHMNYKVLIGRNVLKEGFLIDLSR